MSYVFVLITVHKVLKLQKENQLHQLHSLVYTKIGHFAPRTACWHDLQMSASSGQPGLAQRVSSPRFLRKLAVCPWKIN